MWAGLLAFAAVAYGPALSLPFLGDDYVFLDRTRTSPFANLWSFQNTDFGWYRPWSRELHFWLLQKMAGLNETAFRATGIALWIGVLWLYATIVRRLATARVAGIGTLGAASLALWGTPLLWISGSQDLWMPVFAMASLLLFMAGRTGWALLPFALGLLSKETCAVLPVLLCAYVMCMESRSLGVALQRTAGFWTLVVVWALAHPTLLERLADPTWRQTLGGEHRPSQLGILLRTLLSVINLEGFPHPVEIGWAEVLRLVASSAALMIGATAVFRGPVVPEPGTSSSLKSRLFQFSLVWMSVGWAPLFLPSIGWHAYYGCLGALGAWLALALWLENRPRVAIAALGCLVALQWAHANTRSWDWGNEWYQRRAGNILSAIRDDLLHQYPTLPPHSRVYFGHIPNNIGMIAGQSPAIRVWYRDGTLQAGFYSWYRPRTAREASGADYFFRFDSLAGMVEVRAGPESVERARVANPQWEFDHEALAMLFLRSGDARRAATEFEKLSQLPHRPDAALFASACWDAQGDSSRADSLLAGAATRTGRSWRDLRESREKLRRTMPGRTEAGEVGR